METAAWQRGVLYCGILWQRGVLYCGTLWDRFCLGITQALNCSFIISQIETCQSDRHGSPKSFKRHPLFARRAIKPWRSPFCSYLVGLTLHRCPPCWHCPMHNGYLDFPENFWCFPDPQPLSLSFRLTVFWLQCLTHSHHVIENCSLGLSAAHTVNTNTWSRRWMDFSVSLRPDWCTQSSNKTNPTQSESTHSRISRTAIFLPFSIFFFQIHHHR